jgi:hypothetical protein
MLNIEWNTTMHLNINVKNYFQFCETEGRQASAKAHESVDHLANFPSSREEIS